MITYNIPAVNGISASFTLPELSRYNYFYVAANGPVTAGSLVFNLTDPAGTEESLTEYVVDLTDIKQLQVTGQVRSFTTTISGYSGTADTLSITIGQGE